MFLLNIQLWQYAQIPFTFISFNTQNYSQALKHCHCVHDSQYCFYYVQYASVSTDWIFLLDHPSSN